MLMRENSRATMVLVNDTRHYTRWSEKGAEHCIIALTNSPLFFAAFENAVAADEREVGLVIFDQTITTEEYLEFLSRLPVDYRGDVLVIQKSGCGFLSAAGRAEGRFLYKLSAADVNFYITTAFGEDEFEYRVPLLRAV
jgi:hypothetical protein